MSNQIKNDVSIKKRRPFGRLSLYRPLLALHLCLHIFDEPEFDLDGMLDSFEGLYVVLK